VPVVGSRAGPAGGTAGAATGGFAWASGGSGTAVEVLVPGLGSGAGRRMGMVERVDGARAPSADAGRGGGAGLAGAPAVDACTWMTFPQWHR